MDAQPFVPFAPPNPATRVPDDVAPPRPICVAREPDRAAIGFDALVEPDAGVTVAKPLARPAQGAAHAVVMRFVSGAVVPVGSAGVLVGREPVLGATDDPAMQLVAVADPDRLLSRSHLSITAVADAVLVTDRGSTNGSAIVNAAGFQRPLVPHRPEPLENGDRVLFGGSYADRIS